jgi:hypothetical protein
MAPGTDTAPHSTNPDSRPRWVETGLGRASSLDRGPESGIRGAVRVGGHNLSAVGLQERWLSV